MASNRQPTYDPGELYAMIRELDSEGLMVLIELLQEEQSLYNAPTWACILRSLRFRTAELEAGLS